MRLALCIIAAALFGALLTGATMLRGGEYAMFVFALAMVTIFGAMPVVFGVLTRRREGGADPDDEGAVVIVHREPADAPKADAAGVYGGPDRSTAARTSQERGA